MRGPSLCNRYIKSYFIWRAWSKSASFRDNYFSDKRIKTTSRHRSAKMSKRYTCHTCTDTRNLISLGARRASQIVACRPRKTSDELISNEFRSDGFTSFLSLPREQKMDAPRTTSLCTTSRPRGSDGRRRHHGCHIRRCREDGVIDGNACHR